MTTYQCPISKAITKSHSLSAATLISDFGKLFSSSLFLLPSTHFRVCVFVHIICKIDHCSKAQRFDVLFAANCSVDIGSFL